MTPCHLAEAPLERRGVERAGETNRRGDVVEGIARLELIEEPQPLLGKGQRERPRARHGYERQSRRARRRPPARLDRRGQRPHRGRLEQRAHRQFHAEGVAHPREHLGGEQRMPSQLEEAVLHAHAPRRPPKDVRPEMDEELLGRRARRRVMRGQRRRVRRRQGPPIELAVRREGQLGQRDEGRGDHVLGQTRPDPAPQLRDPKARLSSPTRAFGGRLRPSVRHNVRHPVRHPVRHHVGHETTLTRSILARHHRHLTHGRMLAEHRLHLARLDAKAADLDLRVHAAEELELPIVPPAHPVPRAIEPRPWHAAPGIRHEPLGREVRPTEITARQPHAAEVQLARHAHRHQLHPPVEDEHLDVGERAADRRSWRRSRRRSRWRSRRRGRAIGGGGRRGPALGQGGDHRPLRRPIGVQEPSPRRRRRQPLGHELRRARVAPGDDHAQRRQRRGPGRRQHRRRQTDRGDAALVEEAGERLPGRELLDPRDTQRRPRRERREDLLHREVEGQVGELQQPRARPEVVGPWLVRHQVDDTAVLDQHPLGPPRRARRIDDIGQVPRAHTTRDRSVPTVPISPTVPTGTAGRHPVLPHIVEEEERIEEKVAHTAPRETCSQRRLGEEQPRPAVRQHEAEPIGRQRRVERQVRAAGLEDPEQGDDHARRALHAQADDRFRPHPFLPQAMAEPPRPAHELPVRELLLRPAPEVHRDRLRAPFGLRRHELMEAHPLGERRARALPLHHQLAPLLLIEERDAREPQGRLSGHGREHLAQVAQHPVRRGRLEQLGAILEAGVEPLGVLPEGEHAVELGVPVRQRRGRERQPGQLDARRLEVLQQEQHLEPLPLLAPQRLEMLVGHVLMGERIERHVAHAAEQLAHRGIALESAAQGERVDEQPHQALDLRPVAPRHGRTDHDVVLPRVAREQHLEGGEQDHERRHPLTAAQLVHRGRERRGQAQLGRPCAVRRRAGPRMVERQRQLLGGSGEPLVPPGQLLREPLALELPALPGRVVGILQGQRRERRRTALAGGAVERGQVPDEHPHRPAVRDEVMDGEEERVFALGDPVQGRAEERPLFEIEGPLRLGLRQLPRTPLPLGGRQRQVLQIHDRQGDLGRGRDDLQRAPVLGRERRAQGLVTPHERGQTLLERRERQFAVQVQHDRQVEDRAPRPPLLYEPHPFLGQGQRRGLGAAGLLLKQLRQTGALFLRGHCDVSCSGDGIK